MEKNYVSKSKSNLEELNQKNKIQNKILYKFPIKDNHSNHHNYIGKCYIVNIDFSSKKNLSLPKNKSKQEKLPIINLKGIKPNLKTMTLSKTRRIPDNQKYILSENNESKTIEINYNSIPNLSKITKKKNNYKSHKSETSLTETSLNLKNETSRNKYNDILERINQRYFIKKSTIKYLTNLFFGDDGIHDLKYVNLSKIKDKKQMQKDFNYNLNKRIKYNNNISRYNSYFRKKPLNNKFNSFNEKNDENIKDYKFTKSNIYEKVKKFQDLKIKQSKILVDNALKDLIKTKEKNLIYIENFRKSCDFKFEDF